MSWSSSDAVIGLAGIGASKSSLYSGAAARRQARCCRLGVNALEAGAKKRRMVVKRTMFSELDWLEMNEVLGTFLFM